MFPFTSRSLILLLLTWITSPEFLDHFGLAGVGDLPGLGELRAAGLLEPAGPGGDQGYGIEYGIAGTSEEPAGDEADDGGATES